jgi:hypothetical protein
MSREIIGFFSGIVVIGIAMVEKPIPAEWIIIIGCAGLVLTLILKFAFWLGKKEVTDYYETIELQRKGNHE